MRAKLLQLQNLEDSFIILFFLENQNHNFVKLKGEAKIKKGKRG